MAEILKHIMNWFKTDDRIEEKEIVEEPDPELDMDVYHEYQDYLYNGQ